MRVATSYSLAADTGLAAVEAAASLVDALPTKPNIVVVYATENHARASLIEAIGAAAPSAHIFGGTSCGGVMTEAGFHQGPNGAVGLLGISDPDGAYGVGSAPLNGGAFDAAAQAIQNALNAADRTYEAPVLIWCSQPPGCEEAVIAGIQSVVGAKTPIVGGSTADELVAGNWRQFSSDGVLQDHVVVAALFPSARFGAAFQSGFAPAGDEGVVTRATGRRVLEIDGEPAFEVYNRWTGGAMLSVDDGMNFARSAANPLGRVAGEENGVPMYLLSHPASIDIKEGLSLFTDITEGDRIHLMRGSPDSLVARAAIVVRDALVTSGCCDVTVLGGLVIYCGGCMVHVRDRMGDVASQVSVAMRAPFLGVFTFGEQGALIDSANRHGNLMVAAVTFGR